MDGRSLVPLLRGTTPQNWRTSFLIEYNTDTVFPRVRNMGYKAVRTRRWKYIRYNELDGMDELYDLKTDPYEMNNLADKPDFLGIRQRLDRELDHLITNDR
jgi:N-acetylglucosamine-6-sulfatase